MTIIALTFREETPPLTRGRPKRRSMPLFCLRNTPAYAGKTCSGVSWIRVWMETPPLTRGRPGNVLCRSESLRNTPAYAGKTVARKMTAQRLGKHPRLRGEDCVTVSQTCPISETPPLTRGRLRRVSSWWTSSGNTPAYAGKTLQILRARRGVQKHPRLRGEDKCTENVQKSSGETPPLTRGRLDKGARHLCRPGNTPAYAGKTDGLQCQVIPSPETPPLTRGRPEFLRALNEGLRNTPAYAGKTAGRHFLHAGHGETPPLTRGRQPRYQ